MKKILCKTKILRKKYYVKIKYYVPQNTGRRILRDAFLSAPQNSTIRISGSGTQEYPFLLSSLGDSAKH